MSRPRAADKLTRADVRIAVCVDCGRYRGVDTDTGRCAPGDAVRSIDPKIRAEAIRPVDYCQRNGSR